MANILRHWIRLVEAKLSPAGQLIAIASKTLASDDVSLDLVEVDDDRVTLETLYIRGPRRRKGLGTQTMRMLCQLADDLGVTIELHPLPTEGDIDPHELRAFYHNFGFETDPISGWMVR